MGLTVAVKDDFDHLCNVGYHILLQTMHLHNILQTHTHTHTHTNKQTSERKMVVKPHIPLLADLELSKAGVEKVTYTLNKQTIQVT